MCSFTRVPSGRSITVCSSVFPKEILISSRYSCRRSDCSFLSASLRARFLESRASSLMRAIFSFSMISGAKRQPQLLLKEEEHFFGHFFGVIHRHGVILGTQRHAQRNRFFAFADLCAAVNIKHTDVFHQFSAGLGHDRLDLSDLQRFIADKGKIAGDGGEAGEMTVNLGGVVGREEREEIDFRCKDRHGHAVICADQRMNLTENAEHFSVPGQDARATAGVIGGVVLRGLVSDAADCGERKKIFNDALERVEICVAVHSDGEHAALFGEKRGISLGR